MKKIVPIVALLIVLLFTAHHFKRITYQPAAGESSSVFALSAEDLHAVLFEVFNRGDDYTLPNRFQRDHKFAPFRLYEDVASLQPDEQLDIIQKSEDTDDSMQEEIKRYLAIPAEARKKDLYFYPPVRTDRWLSEEYLYWGKPAEFSSDFILHLEAVDAGHSRLHIFANRSTVLVGKKLGFPARGRSFPGILPDIRSVGVTQNEKAEIFRMLQEHIARTR